jgi:ATP-binding cassette subfamily B protein
LEAAAAMSIFFRVLRYIQRYPALAFGTLACAVLGTLMVVVFPAVTQMIVDEVIRKNQPQLLPPLIAVGLAAFLAQDGLNALRLA